MQKDMPAESPLASAHLHLLDLRYTTRFSELLAPAETEARIGTHPHDIAHQGWAIRVELTSEELDSLELSARAGNLLLSLVHFSAGLPVVVLRTPANGTEFQFGIPLWLAGAQDWLLDAVDRQRILLLLDSAEEDYSTIPNGFENLLADHVSLVAAATLTRELGTEESQARMLWAGLKLMQDGQALATQPSSQQPVVRTSIAGHGKSASAVMYALVEAETARFAAQGRDESVSLEGHAGSGPRD